LGKYKHVLGTDGGGSSSDGSGTGSDSSDGSDKLSAEDRAKNSIYLERRMTRDNHIMYLSL
jgi:hypothetical protein